MRVRVGGRRGGSEVKSETVLNIFSGGTSVANFFCSSFV